MIRLLLIFTLVGYVLYKLGFFRGVLQTRDDRSRQQTYRNGRREGDINIDSVPGKDKKHGDFKGGEYVDYEEVK